MRAAFLSVLSVLAAASVSAQARPAAVTGRWQARTDQAIHHIEVRADSSAQFGEEVARWRVVKDSLWLTVGDGVWMVYAMKLVGDKLTLSGGDLETAVTLRRVGPPSPRQKAVTIPAAPPDTARAW